VIAEPLPADEVSAATCRWLATRYRGEISAEPAARLTGGADFWTYAVSFRGEALPAEWRAPLVARVPPTQERFPMLERESRLQEWAAAQDYPAPAVIDLRPPGEIFERPVQFVRRAPGTTMTAAMTAAPWRVGRLVDRLAGLQVQLHGLAHPPWASGDEWSVVERRLGLVRYVLDRLAHPELEAGFEAVTRLTPRLDVAEPVVCHGDFHPMNVLVDGTQSAVIDWTDAGIGDAHCDVARTAWLFHFAAVAAPQRAERTMLKAIAPWLARRYRRAYENERRIDDDRVRLWMPLHLLHALAMTVADEHELVGASRASTEFSLGLQPWLRHELDAALART
jgi:aminoglycoside phosphotransferase (APT) family kinase protein